MDSYSHASGDLYLKQRAQVKMIRAAVDFALRHRWFMLGVGVFLFGMGFIQFHHLSIEAYPDVANNYAWIITQWPGQAAEESSSRSPSLLKT
ncbi:MAG TPA: hypothetical protein VEF34_05635 [Syntrophobacteraceae bacterium]|nr:hypothetical protein [Syntrophobacteraceae bacterium]